MVRGQPGGDGEHDQLRVPQSGQRVPGILRGDNNISTKQYILGVHCHHGLDSL